MIVRFIVGVVLMGSLVGCTTTQKPATTGQLQIRVTQIESQLDDQSLDITELQSTVKKTLTAFSGYIFECYTCS